MIFVSIIFVKFLATFSILVLFLLTFAGNVQSEDKPVVAPTDRPLSFSAWKRIEIHESQMDVDRISKKLASQRVKVTVNPEIEDQVILPEDKRLLKKIELDFKKATESLNYSKALTFGEYFDVHLKRFKDQPEALKDIANKMSKNSVKLLIEESLRAKVAVVPPPVADPVSESTAAPQAATKSDEPAKSTLN